MAEQDQQCCKKKCRSEYNNGCRGEACQDAHGQRTRQPRQPTPGKPLRYSHNSEPGQGKPGSSAHGAEMLGLRGEVASELKNCGAEQGGTAPQVHFAQQAVSERAGKENVQRRLPLEQFRERGEAEQMGERKERPRRRIKELRVDVGVERESAIGIRIPEGKLPGPETFRSLKRQGEMVPPNIKRNGPFEIEENAAVEEQDFQEENRVR